jgi:rare lipoprotein A
MKQIPFIILTFVTAALCAAQSPGEAPFWQEGIASWYGTEFDGRPTASGELFNPAVLTAAHRTLPFGTIVTVTNTHNNKQVQVRINDRGPFTGARIIDLSRAAAEVLDMIITGTAPVTVEAFAGAAVSPNAPAATAPAAISAPAPARDAPAAISVPAPAATAPAAISAPAPAGDVPVQVPELNAAQPEDSGSAVILGGLPPAGNGKLYRLQVGAYRIPRNAIEAFEKLKGAGLNPAYERSGDLYRVVLAGLKSEDIPLTAEKLGAAGFTEALIWEE